MKSNFELVYEFNKVFQRHQLEALNDITEEGEQQKLKSQLALIEEEVEELKEAIEYGDWEGIKDAVIDILVVTYGMGYTCNIDCNKGLQEVNRANMSKLCTSAQEIEDTVSYYNSGGIRCSVSKVGDSLWAIKSSINQKDKGGKFYPEGKFLKNINWDEPDLGFIEM